MYEAILGRIDAVAAFLGLIRENQRFDRASIHGDTPVGRGRIRVQSKTKSTAGRRRECWFMRVPGTRRDQWRAVLL
jgi:hypothetical protein